MLAPHGNASRRHGTCGEARRTGKIVADTPQRAAHLSGSTRPHAIGTGAGSTGRAAQEEPTGGAGLESWTFGPGVAPGRAGLDLLTFDPLLAPGRAIPFPCRVDGAPR